MVKGILFLRDLYKERVTVQIHPVTLDATLSHLRQGGYIHKTIPPSSKTLDNRHEKVGDGKHLVSGYSSLYVSTIIDIRLILFKVRIYS